MADAACASQGFHDPSNSAEGEEISVPRLEDSISFGRYMSESLEWGKWSSFSQNRHIEEAEKFSKPGSVAQKKAYFESQHKRIAARKAAALLEQANAVTSGGPAEQNSDGGNQESGNTISVYSVPQLAQSPVEVTANVAVQEVAEEADVDAGVLACPPPDSCSNENDSEEPKMEQEGQVLEEETVVELPSTILSSRPPNNSSSEKKAHECVKFEENFIEVENQIPGEASLRIISTKAIRDVKNQNALTEAEPSRTSQPVKPPLQESSAANQEISASKERKQKVSVSKWSIFNRTSMASPSPVKPVPPNHPRRANVTNLSEKSSHEMHDRKISALKSSHMSINFSSQKASATTPSTTKSTSINEKIGDSRLLIRPSKASLRTPHCESPLITSTKVSEAGVPKVVSLTPQSDAKSTWMPFQKTGLKAKKINAMCQSVSTDCWKSSSCSWKRPSQIVFRFRCEERAEKRKEFFLKLEEKLNAEKLQRQAKEKERTENELKRLRQSLGFKAGPMPDFYRKMDSQKDELKKIPPTQAQAPRFGSKVNPLEVPKLNCLPLRSSARKTECFNATEKSSRKPSNSPSLLVRKKPESK